MIDEKKLIEYIEKEFDGVCVYDVSPSQVINDFVQIVDRQPKVGEWIPVSERLPEETDYPEQHFRILASCSDGIVRNATIKSLRQTEEKHRNRGYYFTYVAWMPLPEPYKEEVTE